MLTSTAIGAGDQLPVGWAVLVIILLSLLLWAIVLILLWRLFDTESVADFRVNIKRRLMLLGDPRLAPLDSGRWFQRATPDAVRPG
jgi:hypothetical protein